MQLDIVLYDGVNFLYREQRFCLNRTGIMNVRSDSKWLCMSNKRLQTKFSLKMCRQLYNNTRFHMHAAKIELWGTFRVLAYSSQRYVHALLIYIYIYI